MASGQMSRELLVAHGLLNTAYVLAHQAELAEVVSESVGLEFFTQPAAEA